MSTPVRALLPGLLPNLRDCGGLGTEDGRRLRPRVLLRSAALVGLSPAALAGFTEAVRPGVYVDLRTDAEIARDGEPRGLLEAGWRWHRVPVDDGTAGLEPGPEAGRRTLEALPRFLAAADQVAGSLGPRPVLVGCAVGKDRTGLVTAIVLRWLGIRRAEILDDFTLSDGCLSAGRALLPPRWQDPGHMLAPTDPAVCAAVLDRLPDRAVFPGPAAFARPLNFLTPRPEDPGASTDAPVAAAARRFREACDANS